MRLCTIPPRRMLFVVLLFAPASLSSAALAKAPPSSSPVTLDSRRAEPTFARGLQRIGVTSGVPRALYNVNYAVDEDVPEAMARQYLRENGDRLRLVDPLLGDLVHRATRRGLAGTTVRFEQRFQGIPVLASDLAVTIGRDRKSTRLNSSHFVPSRMPSSA